MSNWDKEKIKNLRKSMGLSQSEFAFKLGCRQQTVSEWELGLYAPANAYGKLLSSFNSIAATSTSWLSTPKSKTIVEELAAGAAKQWSESVEEQEEPEVREFDPAID